MYEPGDAAATAANIVANATLVRLSFVADLIQALVWLVLAVVLYRLLAHAGRNIARAMVVFVAVSAAITSLNMVHQLGALLVATNHSYVTAFGADGSHALVLLLMDLQHYGYLIAQLDLAVALRPRPARLPVRHVPPMALVPAHARHRLLRHRRPDPVPRPRPSRTPRRPSSSLPEIVCEVALLAYLLIKGVRTPTDPQFTEPVPA